MITAPARAAGVVIEHARVSVGRSMVRRRLRAVADGRAAAIEIDLHRGPVDVVGELAHLTARMADGSPPLARLQAAFDRTGACDAAIDGLASRVAVHRIRSARSVGALKAERAVAWVAPLLSADEAEVREAAARALGRIGGVRSADALGRAIERRGATRTLIVELSRAAPDLYLEAALFGPRRAGVIPAVAAAAGLRRRQTAVGPLLALLVSGSRKERVVACRALGWIGARRSVPVLIAAIADREWKVRLSAAKSLAALHAPARGAALEALLADRHPRVQKAGRQAQRRLARE